MPVEAALRARLERGEVVTDSQEGHEGRKNARAQFLIAAPPEKIWAAITDYDRYKEFMPYTTESRIVKRTDDEVWFATALGFSLKTVRYTIHLKLDKPRWRIEWSLVEGDLKHNDGGWQLEPHGDEGDTFVTYWAHVTPLVAVPAFIVNTVTRGSLPSLVEALRKRVDDWKYV